MMEIDLQPAGLKSVVRALYACNIDRRPKARSMISMVARIHRAGAAITFDAHSRGVG